MFTRLVRDQANKCFDVYLQRIRKYGNSLPDTVSPPTTVVTNDGVPRMGTTQSDMPGWAGWAISSFTNKLATASGDMQSKAAELQQAKTDRSLSVPPAVNSSRPFLSASASTLHRQAAADTSTAARPPTPTEQYFGNPIGVDDGEDVDEAWGEMAEDSFFDAPAEAKPDPTPPIMFDDGGEPDFEGWLKAQAQTKPKAPLPKGLAKSSVNVSNGRQALPRTATVTTTGSGTGVGAKKLASTAAESKSVVTKNISTKPKEADDDWGDAWD